MSRRTCRGCLVLILIAMVVTLACPTTAQDATAFPLAATGPYVVGLRTLSVVDASREGRKIDLAIWYPAIKPDTQQPAARDPSIWGWTKAMPDLQAAPYPLILYSHDKDGTNTELHALNVRLASQGYVVVGLGHPLSMTQNTLVDRPQDILFVIDQLAAMTTGELAGLIDTDHVGVMGLGLGAYTALAVSGARIDPASAGAWASKPLDLSDVTNPINWWDDWNWDKLAAYRASLSPLPDEGLWPAYTDSRIKAVMMLTLCFRPMFGDKGLAAATVPALFMAATSEFFCPYEPDTSYAFAHLGSQDRYLLTVTKSEADPINDKGYASAVDGFAGAFFGRYLAGKQDNAQYLTADYVNSAETQLKLGLMWGPAPAK